MQGYCQWPASSYKLEGTQELVMLIRAALPKSQPGDHASAIVEAGDGVAGLRLFDLDADDLVALTDGADGVEAGRDAAEDGVAAVQVRLGGGGGEELAAVGGGGGVCHREGAGGGGGPAGAG